MNDLDDMINLDDLCDCFRQPCTKQSGHVMFNVCANPDLNRHQIAVAHEVLAELFRNADKVK